MSATSAFPLSVTSTSTTSGSSSGNIAATSNASCTSTTNYGICTSRIITTDGQANEIKRKNTPKVSIR